MLHGMLHGMHRALDLALPATPRPAVTATRFIAGAWRGVASRCPAGHSRNTTPPACRPAMAQWRSTVAPWG